MSKRDNPRKAYKLLIEWKPEIFDKEVPEYLTSNEVIRGRPFEISFSITNIGESDFPGGDIQDFSFSWPSGWTTIFTLSSEDKTVPEIPEGKTITKNLGCSLDNEGLTSMEFRMVPKKEGEILYYKSRERPPMKDSFHGTALFSVNREEFEIIKLLRKLQNHIGRRDNDAIK